MKICGELILAKGSKINLTPYCLHLDIPDWIVQFSTSRIIAADNGHQGAKILSKPNSSILKSRAEEAVKVKIQAPKEPMIYLITADTDSEGIHFREWLETIIKDK